MIHMKARIASRAMPFRRALNRLRMTTALKKTRLIVRLRIAARNVFMLSGKSLTRGEAWRLTRAQVLLAQHGLPTAVRQPVTTRLLVAGHPLFRCILEQRIQDVFENADTDTKDSAS